MDSNNVKNNGNNNINDNDYTNNTTVTNVNKHITPTATSTTTSAAATTTTTTATNLDETNGDNFKATVDISTVQVPRTITLTGAISFIVGTIIGSGIFISPKGVAEGSGSVGFTLVSWTICGIVSMLAALCYAEMGSVVKESGGDYAFFMRAYGKVVAYMFAWCWGLLLKPASMATLAITCSEYLLTPLFEDGCGEVNSLLKKLFAVTLILVLAAISIYSSKLASKIQIIFTVAKLLALGIIIVGGIVKLFQGYTEYLSTGFKGTSTKPGVIALGFYSGMFAFDGWNAANFITEEIINPQRNLPLAIIIGVPVVIGVYVLTNVSYFTVMSMQEMIDSTAVAITWADRVIPKVAWIIPIFVAMSAFGSANGSFFSTSRLIFVAARNDHLPKFFGMINVERLTPVPASVLMALIAILFVIPGNVGALITFVSFIKWMFYGMNMISIIIFRYRYPYKEADRPFRVPLIIPIFVFLAAIFIVIVPIVTEPQIEFLFAFIFILIGYLLYIPFVHFKLYPKCMDYVTIFLQLFFQISTPQKLD
ncbi:hypothetical protein HELRODRAFT_110971 [Helobdella robusta]|uniref:b(0,+)-type amino acid transporter 1 n=1 Tax=Helobdella robusta TaxID=6412 RepID=T1EF67_HELRO|nr:hypothetical protein HELRODRAFT_110971 [Helobdella robusta]ESO06959.1 hypothetical protein HELRODRAFT_110971 [Helobdella robusta]